MGNNSASNSFEANIADDVVIKNYPSPNRVIQMK